MAQSGWNQETKAKLSEKLLATSTDLASLSRQLTRGSKAQEVEND